MTSVDPAKGRDKRRGIIAPGANMDTRQGLKKINASTGEMTPIFKQHAPSNGAVLATAGDMICWGDRDPFISPAFAERFGAQEVYHFAQYGHWLPLEAPEALATHLDAFFSSERA